MDVGWKSFEASNSKNLDCLEEIVDKNMDIKGNFGVSSEREESCSESSIVLKTVYNYEQNVARNMNANDVSGKVSDRILDTDTNMH